MHPEFNAAQSYKDLRRAKELKRGVFEDSELCVRPKTTGKSPTLRDNLPILASTEPALWSQEKEAVSHGSSRRNTEPGGLITSDSEALTAASVASRAESAPEIGIRPLRNSWVLTKLKKSNLTMPSGKFIQAAFSATGLTLVLLSAKQVVVHPLDVIPQTKSTSSISRYQLVKPLGELILARNTGNIRSVSVADDFVLFRGAGQVTSRNSLS